MSKPALSLGSVGTKPTVFGPADAGTPPPPMRPDLVQKHLEKVLVSAEMCRSKKLCQFLRFTVEEVLRGHGSELKEYAIAVGVFRRSREFDPAADPIVRVQARRLRSKLERYYQNEGSGEPIRIEYPLGGYSPVFMRSTPAAATALPAVSAVSAREDGAGRRIAVLPFADVGPEDSQNFCDGLTDELIHALSIWPGLQVVARASCFQFKGKSEDVRRIGESLGVCTLVSGTVRKEGQRLRVLAQLIDTGTGMHLWSAGYVWELAGVLETQQGITRQLTNALQFHLGGRETGRAKSRRDPKQQGNQ
jgi:serine/threonine-protein kinase